MAHLKKVQQVAGAAAAKRLRNTKVTAERKRDLAMLMHNIAVSMNSMRVNVPPEQIYLWVHMTGSSGNLGLNLKDVEDIASILKPRKG